MRKRIYVCHPFAADPAGNIERVRAIAKALVDEGVYPVAPQLYLPQWIDEATGRELAMSLCLELVGTCDELRVYGTHVSDGMRREIAEAQYFSIPIRWVEGREGG